MIPLADHNPTHQIPLVTWLFIAICVVVFCMQLTSPFGFDTVTALYGFVPAVTLYSGEPIQLPTGFPPEFATGLAHNPGWPTVFSSMFMHGSVMHIAGNMLYLYVFGDNIENTLGKTRFTLFYLIGGIAAALTQALMDTASPIPMVGASGAISAILGAYLVLYPKQPITVFIPNMGLTQMPALAVLGLWFGYQLISQFASGGDSGVAFGAHIGGFVAGFLLIRLFKPRQQSAEPTLWR